MDDLYVSELELPGSEEVILAKAASRKLIGLPEHEPIIIKSSTRESSDAIELPPTAVRLLIDLLEQMSQGNAVTIIPVHAMLTTQQAADLLNVSRPFLVGLLEKGEISFTKIGTHRRVSIVDLLNYKKDRAIKRNAALAELAAIDQELDLD